MSYTIPEFQYTDADKTALEEAIMSALRKYEMPLQILYEYLIEIVEFYKFVEGRSGRDATRSRIEKRLLQTALIRLRKRGRVWVNSDSHPSCWCVDADEEARDCAPEPFENLKF